MHKVPGFIGIFFWMVIFFLRGWFFRRTISDPVDQRNALAKNTSFISRKMLKSFGIRVKVNNTQNLDCLKTENHLIIANHVSYTDILVLSSIYPFVFITSVEMSEAPFLGDITRIGGSLFTNRKKFTSLPQEIQNFADALGKGFNIALFPEGTSTNGETIKDFRKSLFQTSIIAQKPVLPICVRYTTLDAQPIRTQAQRDIVCWYGDMTFVPHFWKLLGHRIEAEVNVLDPIPFDPTVNRQQLCDKVQNLQSSLHTKRWYTATEFHMKHIRKLPGNKLELGRACVHPDYRNGVTISLLWEGIHAYMLASDTQYLFGCSSIKTIDKDEIRHIYNYLKHYDHLSDEHKVRPKGRFNMFGLRRHLKKHPHYLAEGDNAIILDKIPTLLQSYLKVGAKVCGRPAIDKSFRCIDFLTLLDVTDLREQYARRLKDREAPKQG